MFTRVIAYLRGLARRRRIDDEIREELQDHVEREVERHRALGVAPDEARRLALRDLGGLTQTTEAVRDVRAIWLDTAWRDTRYAARMLRRSPRFTITALTLLTLGIGSATAIFSVAYAVLVRPLPYADPDRLVYLAEKDRAGIAWPNFADWRQRATSFDGLASSLADAVNVTSGPLPRRFESRSVTSNFFRVLGVPAMRGRLFDESDARPGATATVVVSHAFWMRELGGDDRAIGQPITLRNPFVVIGVLPPDFRYMTPADLYLLLEPQVAANYRGMPNRRTHTTLFAVARLKPEVSVAAARTEMQAIAAALALEYPDTNTGSDVHLVALSDRIVQDVAPTLTVLAGAVALLLLIACVNLASLLLNKSAARAQEFGIRAAIGGGRWSLIRQLLIEQALLVTIGGVLGALAGAAILAGLVALAPRDTPRLDEIGLDWFVLGLTTLIGCACAFVCGVVPAVKASGIGGPQMVIRSGRGMTHSTSALRRTLMIAEIAVATVLLSGSGLMVHTMLRLAQVDLGFDPHNLQTFMFSLTGPAYPDAKKQVFYETVVDRLRAVPGVENAALTYSLPILGSNWWSSFTIAGRPAPDNIRWSGIVPMSATYFDTMRMHVLRGRGFDRSETPDSLPVAVINEHLARQFGPNQDPIGQQIRLGMPAEPYGPWRTIVGIVGDLRQEGIDQETNAQLYVPIVQQPRTTVFAVVRTRGPAQAAAVEAAFHELDKSLPLFNERTVDQVIREASSRRRVAMIVLSVFGGVALLLATIGLYGVIAQGIAERRQEIGVRMALGATRRQVVGLFLRHGVLVVALGIGCGVLSTLAVAQSLASLVFGVTPKDPGTLAGVVVLLSAVTLLASYLSSRSATRVDPLSALRSE